MDDTFPQLVHKAMNLLVYGCSEEEVAEMLKEATKDPILVVQAAKLMLGYMEEE